MNNYYFTFGGNQTLRDCYVQITAEDREEARKIMMGHYGRLWAFQYTEEEFAGQPQEYGLQQVRLGTPNLKR